MVLSIDGSFSFVVRRRAGCLHFRHVVDTVMGHFWKIAMHSACRRKAIRICGLWLECMWWSQEAFEGSMSSSRGRKERRAMQGSPTKCLMPALMLASPSLRHRCFFPVIDRQTLSFRQVHRLILRGKKAIHKIAWIQNLPTKKRDKQAKSRLSNSRL
jgi:hypothetical protein